MWPSLHFFNATWKFGSETNSEIYLFASGYYVCQCYALDSMLIPLNLYYGQTKITKSQKDYWDVGVCLEESEGSKCYHFIHSSLLLKIKKTLASLSSVLYNSHENITKKKLILC